MPLDKDTALDLLVALRQGYSIQDGTAYGKNAKDHTVIRVLEAWMKQAKAAIEAAEADPKPFRPGTPGLHANVTDFGMSIELAYVCLPVPDAPVVQFLRDHEHFRRLGMQRDTPQTVVAKLRALAQWIEEHT